MLHPLCKADRLLSQPLIRCRQCNQEIDDNPTNSKAYLKRSICYMRQHNYEEVLNDAMQSTKLNDARCACNTLMFSSASYSSHIHVRSCKAEEISLQQLPRLETCPVCPAGTCGWHMAYEVYSHVDACFTGETVCPTPISSYCVTACTVIYY